MRRNEYVTSKAGLARDDGCILSVSVSIADHSNGGFKTPVFLDLRHSFICGS